MKKLTPTLGTPTRYQLKYNNKLLLGSVRTNYFTVNINGSQDEVYITDKPDETFTTHNNTMVKDLTLQKVTLF